VSVNLGFLDTNVSESRAASIFRDGGSTVYLTTTLDGAITQKSRNFTQPSVTTLKKKEKEEEK
jgi:hypothetical protein